MIASPRCGAPTIRFGDVVSPSRAEVSSSEVDDPSDETLMLTFRDGDRWALGVLFDRYASRVEALVLRLTGRPALARDITQTTFLSVVKGRHRYVDDCRFRPWLYTIAMNALRDHLRRAKREVLVPADGAMLDQGVHHDPLPDPGLRRELIAALAMLPLDQRQAVTLHHMEGLSFDEVAEVVGCSRTAAKVRAHRGYRRLREHLKGTWEA